MKAVGTPRWRILSRGTAATTKVFLGDVDVSQSIHSVKFLCDAGTPSAEALEVALSSRHVDVEVVVNEVALNADAPDAETAP